MNALLALPPPPTPVINKLEGLQKLLVSPTPITLGEQRGFVAPKYDGLTEILTRAAFRDDDIVLTRYWESIYLFAVGFHTTQRPRQIACSTGPNISGFVVGTQLLNPQPSPNMAQFDQVRYLPASKRFINCRTGDPIICADVLFMQNVKNAQNEIIGVDARVIEHWNP